MARRPRGLPHHHHRGHLALARPLRLSPMKVDDRARHLAVHRVVEDVVVPAGKLLELQRFYLLGVGLPPRRSARSDRPRRARPGWAPSTPVGPCRTGPRRCRVPGPMAHRRRRRRPAGRSRASPGRTGPPRARAGRGRMSCRGRATPGSGRVARPRSLRRGSGRAGRAAATGSPRSRTNAPGRRAAGPGRSPSASSVSASARSELSAIDPKSPRGPGLSPWPNWSTAHRSMPAALSAKPYRW